VRWQSRLPSINRSSPFTCNVALCSLFAAIGVSTKTGMAEIDDTAKGGIDWNDWALPGKDDGKAV
jgi:hypothetical protein